MAIALFATNPLHLYAAFGFCPLCSQGPAVPACPRCVRAVTRRAALRNAPLTLRPAAVSVWNRGRGSKGFCYWTNWRGPEPSAVSRPEATVSLIQTDFKYEVFAFFDKFFPIIFFSFCFKLWMFFFFLLRMAFTLPLFSPKKKKKKGRLFPVISSCPSLISCHGFMIFGYWSTTWW